MGNNHKWDIPKMHTGLDFHLVLGPLCAFFEMHTTHFHIHVIVNFFPMIPNGYLIYILLSICFCLATNYNMQIAIDQNYSSTNLK
jgi:hypothetical protein